MPEAVATTKRLLATPGGMSLSFTSSGVTLARFLFQSECKSADAPMPTCTQARTRIGCAFADCSFVGSMVVHRFRMHHCPLQVTSSNLCSNKASIN
jgi:hypothetical protein